MRLRDELARKTRVIRLVAGVLVAAVAAVAAQDASADEPRVLRVVGVQPLDASASKAGGPRQGAVNEALYEAVARVALELVDEYGPPVPDDDAGEAGGDDATAPAERGEDWLKGALGKDMTPFARSFRIVDDQGSRPVLFPGESKATHEYVVVVETTVDVDRVRDRLAEQGIIAVEVEEVGDDGVEIEALGLRHWSGYEALVALLEGPGVRASEVRPVEFEAGRAVVYAVVRGSPEDVLVRVLESAPIGLEITSGTVERDRGMRGDGAPRIRLELLWTPPPSQG